MKLSVSYDVNLNIGRLGPGSQQSSQVLFYTHARVRRTVCFFASVLFARWSMLKCVTFEFMRKACQARTADIVKYHDDIFRNIRV